MADRGTGAFLARIRPGISLAINEAEGFREKSNLFCKAFPGPVFGDSAVKVGRVQIPFGIYNEVRDVGTILPFFRHSLDFYGEGSFNSETVDGIVLSHNFGGSDTVFFLSEVKDSYGFELWLQTPLPGAADRNIPTGTKSPGPGKRLISILAILSLTRSPSTARSTPRASSSDIFFR